MILTFDAQAVRNLVEISRSSSNRRATIGQSCMKEYLRDDLDPKSLNDMLDGTIEGDYDPAKIPEGVWLIGNCGVYVMSNAPMEEVEAAGFNPVVYAREANPETMAPVLVDRAKENSFGGDDGVEFIDSEILERALVGDFLCIDMTPEEMSLLVNNRFRETCPETPAPSPF